MEEALENARLRFKFTHPLMSPKSAMERDEKCVQTLNCEPLIDCNRAAEIIGIHPKTIKRMAKNGEVPALKIGRLWKFRESALDEWLRTNLISSCHPCPRKEGDE